MTHTLPQQLFILFAIVVVLKSYQVHSFGIIKKQNTSGHMDLIVEEIIHIIRQYFNKNQFLVVVVRDTANISFIESIVTKIHENIEISIILVSLRGKLQSVSSMKNHAEFSSLGQAEFFLIITEDVSSFQSTLKELKNHFYWNARAKVLVVTYQDATHDGGLTNIFHSAWNKHQILKMVVITAYSTCKGLHNAERMKGCYALINYNPFLEYAFKSTIPFSSINIKTDVNSINLFRDKTKNMHGYPIKVAWYDVPPYFVKTEKDNSLKLFDGNFAQMLETQAKLMNFTLIPEIFQKYESGGVYIAKNNTWIGLINDLMEHRADVLPPGVTQSYRRSLVVEFTLPIVIDTLAFAVPNPKLVPYWQILKEPLSFNVWILLFTVFALMSIFIVACDYAVHKLRIIFKHKLTCLALLSIILSMSLPRLPKRNLQRIVFILTSLFMLVMNASYQGSLISFMTNPRHYPEIDTFEALASSCLSIKTILPFIKFVEDTSNPTLKSLASRTKQISSYNAGLHSVCYKGDSALLSGKILLEYNKFVKYVDPYGDPLFHIVKETIHHLLLGYAVPKGSPYLPRWNSIISRASEAGLIHKWLKEYDRNKAHVFYLTKEKTVILAWKHLQTAFYILGVGLTFGVIAHIVEILMLDVKVVGKKCQR